MLKGKRHGRRASHPLRRIVLGFALIILIGAALLSLPASSASGERTDPLTALFTAVSATCVTGLVRVDTALHWSVLGRCVILALIQIGGVGFMTAAVMLIRAFGGRLSVSSRITAASSFGYSDIGDIVPLVKRIFKGTLVIELSGAVLLSVRFIPLFGFGRGALMSVFHSVSAFCNAGFDLMGDVSGAFTSLSVFGDEPYVSIVVSLLIILGGIGFVVWDDVLELIRHRRRISVYSRIVITASAVLTLLGGVAFLAIEYSNPDTIGGYDLTGKLAASLFQSVTTRTAGFASVDLASTHPLTQFIFLGLMFIGGSAGSTAGGVKTATIAVLVMSVVSIIRGRRSTVIFKRTVPPDAVRRALGIVAVQFILSMSAVCVLISQGCELMPALFECVSAGATVGLSLSLTPSLPVLSEVTVMMLMFLGRVGILTFTHALKRRTLEGEHETEYAAASIAIG